MVYRPELLNAKELNRHVLQARCRHGPEQYLAICSRVQKIDLRQQFCTTEADMRRHDHTRASTAKLVFYSPLLNAKEFIQTLLRASYTHVPEHYSIKINFVVRPAARGKITLESDHSNASNAAMRFFCNFCFKHSHWGAPVRL